MITINKLLVLLFSIFSIGLLTYSFFLSYESQVYRLITYYDFALCIYFLYDFLKQLFSEENKWRYFYTVGWLDFISSIPVITEFRVLRFIRVIRVIKIIRSIRTLIKFISQNKKESLFGFIVFLVVVSIVITSTAVLYFEKDVGNITTAEDALWWTFITITTVGYGDYYPVTGFGKLAASFLIATGIGFFGAVISFVTDKVNSIKSNP
ncbi:potassium channel family protein [Psychroflexus planctonicus]|uniref:Ion transporter n=1 Tax=Psychroflexus planctonicus TaxID=1526575 RepID=A0ABQ1SD00_9FLAO|nr:potassium channel family protein [Psychroflexus planctonicus]GGE23358.1 ion transporter [Psychroflexus planctonicus]